MRLEQLEYFVAAAEAGSISGAAQRLKVSQPAVSAALRSLEEELGGRLFSRGNQGISLTLLGRLTCDDARKMLKLARGMLARGRNAGARGAAQVCAQPLLSFHLTGNIIVPFRELHPDIDVFVRNVPNADIVAELKGGRAGIAVTLVALGLKFIPEKMINGFQIFAKFLVALITLGLAAAVVKFLLGWELIPGLDPIFMAPGDKPGEVMRAIEVIGSISCVLLGAYPMVLLLTRWFEKPADERR